MINVHKVYRLEEQRHRGKTTIIYEGRLLRFARVLRMVVLNEWYIFTLYYNNTVVLGTTRLKLNRCYNNSELNIILSDNTQHQIRSCVNMCVQTLYMHYLAQNDIVDIVSKICGVYSTILSHNIIFCVQHVRKTWGLCGIQG